MLYNRIMKNIQNEGYISKFSFSIIRTALYMQPFVIAPWLVTHLFTLRILAIVLVLIVSVVHFALGIILKNSEKYLVYNRSIQLLLVIPGITSILIALAGFVFIIAPLLVQIPIFGGLMILYSNFLLGNLFANYLLLILLVFSAILAALCIALLTRKPA